MEPLKNKALPNAQNAPVPPEKDADFSHCTQAMRSYLQQIGRIPLLTEEESRQLRAEILAAEDRWRDRLYGFAGIADRHAALIADSTEGMTTALVIPSCLPVTEADLRAWGKTLERQAGRLRTACEEEPEGKAAAKARKTLIATLRKYLFSTDLLRRMQETLQNAVPADPDSDAGRVLLAAVAEESGFSPEALLREIAALREEWSTLEALRQHMVEANLRMVVCLVNRLGYRNLPVADMVQEGNIGLMKSLEKFDFRLQHKFSTYASWWIKQSVSRAVNRQCRIIRIPAHMIATIGAINRAEQRFILENDREPEIFEIAEILNLPTARVSAIRRMARQVISLQSPLGSSDGHQSTLADLIPDEQAYNPSNMVADHSTAEWLRELLAQLDPRSREILEMRFGLFGHAVRTLREISEHFQISRERVRQLEAQILNKLREQKS